MGTIDLLTDETVSYSGFFNLQELYSHLHDWLEWRKFDVAEKKYKEKLKAPAKDIEIEWEATKEIDEYSMFTIKLKWKISGLTEEEVLKDGKKQKMNKGDVEIKVSAVYTTDHSGAWDKKPMLKFMKFFYEKYLYKSSAGKLKGDLWNTGWALFNEIKSFLNLYRFG